MNDSTLEALRGIAEQMMGPEQDRRWEWIGAHMSQRMFGITQERAERFARQYGGVARRMEVTP
jgi:hypothetical protein